MRAPRRTGEEIATEICHGRRQLWEPVVQAIRVLANYSPKMEPGHIRVLIEAARKAREVTDHLQGLFRSLEQEELIRSWPSLYMRVGWLHPAGELRATIGQLEKMRHFLHWLERVRTLDPRIGDIQEVCAFMTLGLIEDEGLPVRELRRTASLFYEAATGKQNVDLKRACVRARKKWDASRKNRTKASQRD
jgi:hypothetical protein